MKLRALYLVAALGAIAGCGGANAGPLGPPSDGGAGGSGGAGGTGGQPPLGQSSFRLNCERDMLQLSLAIELAIELTSPFSSAATTEATLSASVTFDEGSVASLLDGGFTVIDIASMSITTDLSGATPATMTASLGDTPINDFDLQADPDDDGMPGPHRFELDPVTATATTMPGASEVVFNLGFDGISFVLGDFNIPTNCVSPSLGGVQIGFPVAR